jgi:hypothetical protein
MSITCGLQRQDASEKGHTRRAVLLALIHEIFVLASRGRFEAIAIDKLKLREEVRMCP